MAKIPIPLKSLIMTYIITLSGSDRGGVLYIREYKIQLLALYLTSSAYLGKYSAGSIVITIPGKSGVDFEIDGVSCTSIPR